MLSLDSLRGLTDAIHVTCLLLYLSWFGLVPSYLRYMQCLIALIRFPPIEMEVVSSIYESVTLR